LDKIVLLITIIHCRTTI